VTDDPRPTTDDALSVEVHAVWHRIVFAGFRGAV